MGNGQSLDRSEGSGAVTLNAPAVPADLAVSQAANGDTSMPPPSSSSTAASNNSSTTAAGPPLQQPAPTAMRTPRRPSSHSQQAQPGRAPAATAAEINTSTRRRRSDSSNTHHHQHHRRSASSLDADWDPEHEPSRRVRARLADALLSLSSSPGSEPRLRRPSSSLLSYSPPETPSTSRGQREVDGLPHAGDVSVGDGGDDAGGSSSALFPSAGPSDSGSSRRRRRHSMSLADYRQAEARQSHPARPSVPYRPVSGESFVRPGFGYGSRPIRALPRRAANAEPGAVEDMPSSSSGVSASDRPVSIQASSGQETSAAQAQGGVSETGPGPMNDPAPAPTHAFPPRIRRTMAMPVLDGRELTPHEMALLEEHSTLSALLAEVVGGVPPPVPAIYPPGEQSPATGSSAPERASSEGTASASSGSGNASSSTRTSEPSQTGSRPSQSGRRTGGGRGSRGGSPSDEIRTGTSIVVQGALYTRTTHRGSGVAPSRTGTEQSSRTSTERPHVNGSSTSAPQRANVNGHSHQHANPSSSQSSQNVPQGGPASSPAPGSNTREIPLPQVQHHRQMHAVSPDGPSPEERALMLNRLLRVAAAATAATVVARGEGLPPPATGVSGHGLAQYLGREARRAEARANAGSRGAAAGGRAASSRGQQQQHQPQDAATASVPVAGAGADAGQRPGMYRPHHQRSMQRSVTSLDLLGNSRTPLSRNGNPSTRSFGRIASMSGLSSLSPSTSSSLSGSISSLLGALRGRRRRTSTSSLPAGMIGGGGGLAGENNGDGNASPLDERRPGSSLRQRLASLTSRMRPSNAFAPAAAAASSSTTSAGAGENAGRPVLPPWARAVSRLPHDDEPPGGGGDAEALTDMLRASLAQPLPSQIFRRTRAPTPHPSRPGSAAAASGSGSPSGSGPMSSVEFPQSSTSAQPSSQSTDAQQLESMSDNDATGAAPASGASAAESTPASVVAAASAHPGVRVDIRDSAASISAALERARAGVGEHDGGVTNNAARGSFEWFLDSMFNDLMGAMREMDLEQERRARLGAVLRGGEDLDSEESGSEDPGDEEEGSWGRRSETPSFGDAMWEPGADEPADGAEAEAEEEDWVDYGSASSSTTSSRSESRIPAYRRADVSNSELSFFRVFCFPRANQAGVVTDADAPRPSTTVPPPGEPSTGSGEAFVLHPDLIPCVVVGVRSMTAFDEEEEGEADQHSARRDGRSSRSAGDAAAASEPAVEQPEPESEPRIRSAGPGPWPTWARRFQWPSSSRNAPANATHDADGDAHMQEASGQDPTDDEDEEGEDGEEEEEQPGLLGRSWRFSLWISGGFWPRTHPLLNAPAAGAGRDLMLLIEFLTAMNGANMPPPGRHPQLQHGPGPHRFPRMGPPLPSPAGGGVPINGVVHQLFGLFGFGATQQPVATKEELERSEQTRVAKGWELAGVRAKQKDAGALIPSTSGMDDDVDIQKLKARAAASAAAAAAGLSERVAEKRREVHSGAEETKMEVDTTEEEALSLIARGVVLESTAQRCLICLEDWEDDDDVRVLSCRHAFHVGCVDRWLTGTSNTCPLCRKAGVTKNDSAPLLAEGVPAQ